jgi:hypothetical protein
MPRLRPTRLRQPVRPLHGLHNGRTKRRHDAGASARRSSNTHSDYPRPARRVSGGCCAWSARFYSVGLPSEGPRFLCYDGHAPRVPLEPRQRRFIRPNADTKLRGRRRVDEAENILRFWRGASGFPALSKPHWKRGLSIFAVQLVAQSCKASKGLKCVVIHRVHALGRCAYFAQIHAVCTGKWRNCERQCFQ